MTLMIAGVASWDAATDTVNEDGTFTLPHWMRLRCATAERSAQTSATTVRTGFAAHAARAFSRDGATWGLLVEPGAVNLQPDQDFTAWNTGGTSPTVTTVTAPDGSNTAVQVVDDDAGTDEYIFDHNAMGVAPALHTISSWSWVVALSAGNAQIKVREAGASDFATINMSSADSGWTMRSATWSGAAGITPAEVHIIPASSPANTGTLRAWGAQVEERAYPTSFIGADNATFTRAADVLSVVGDVFAPGGFFDVTLRIRLHYAETEASGEHNLIYAGDDDNRVYLDAGTLTMVIGGDAIAIAATWSRDQVLTITVRHSPLGRRMTLAGATTGDGSVNGEALGPIDVPDWVYLLGTSFGADEGSDLGALYLNHLTAFCTLAQSRALVQMGDDFHSLLCVLAEQPGELFDAVEVAKNSLALGSAEGEQLDQIGSVVGLSREGFTDTRYRVFLAIQVALLLSAGREDREWTGTAPNLITIARTFIGDDADHVWLQNAPPYAYQLQVSDLVLDEAPLLRRFLRAASYAAVYGVIVVVLDADSLWDSDAVSVDGGGIWGSASVTVTGEAVWNTVITVE